MPPGNPMGYMGMGGSPMGGRPMMPMSRQMIPPPVNAPPGSAAAAGAGVSGAMDTQGRQQMERDMLIQMLRQDAGDDPVGMTTPRPYVPSTMTPGARRF